MGNRNVSKKSSKVGARLNKAVSLKLKAIANGDLEIPVGQEDGKSPIVEQFDAVADVTSLEDKDLYDALVAQRLDANERNIAFVRGLSEAQGLSPEQALKAGEEKYLRTMLGGDRYRKVPAMLKRLDREDFSVWIQPYQGREQMSDAQKGFLETRAHGVVETAVTYVLQDGHAIKYAYDGDDEVDPQLAADEQPSRSFIIPYVRYQDAMGESHVEMVGPYKKLHIYIARQLPLSKGSKPMFLQDKLQSLWENNQHATRQSLQAIMFKYQNMMRDRSPEIQTVLNGWKHVYYVQFPGLVVYSPIVYSELADGARALVDARNRVSKMAKAFKEAIDIASGGESFLKAKELYKQLLSEIHAQKAWWLWRDYVKPYQGLMADDITADDLGL